MRQLEPGASECIRELVGIGQESTGDLLVDWIDAKSDISRQHRRGDSLVLVVRVRDRSRSGIAFGFPLMCPAGALGQFPFVAEEIFEIAIAPFRGRIAP